MRLIGHRNLRVYAWRRGSMRRNGHRRDCHGFEVRWRRGREWYALQATARVIARSWGRVKAQGEVTLWKIGPDGRRDRRYKKRFLRVVLGTGGQGSGPGQGGGSK